MIRLTLQGVVGFEGTYDLDLEKAPLTNRELHWIKQISGVRLGEMEEAADALDNDLVVAFAVVGLVRAGRASKQNWQQLADLLWESEAGKIQAEEIIEEREGDDSPPPSKTPVSETDSSNGSNESPENSSDSSKPTGDTSQEMTPVFSGDPS